jgi:hypothetical protein
VATELVRYDAMCRAIDAAYEVDEVKEIRDKALAIEVYAKQAKNTEAERRACEIRLRAERKAGQLLASMAKAKGARGNPNGRGAPIVPSEGARPQTLSELGITHDQSSKWQQLAAVPEQEFESALAAPEKPSTNGIIGKKPEPMNPRALWLWGRLRDFERDGLLDDEQSALLNEMTDAMRADVRRLAPLVARWLEGVSDE